MKNIENQKSGLSDFELELEKIVYKIKSEPSTLRCIKFLESLRKAKKKALTH